MITFLHQKFRILLIFVLAIVAISFVFFGNWTPAGPASGPLGKIDGEWISPPVFGSAFTATQLIFTLRTGIPPEDAGAFASRLERDTWIRMAVIAAARDAGLTATPQMIAQWLQELPLFAGPDGRYSPERFAQFQAAYLNPRNISDQRLAEIVRDEILFESMVAAVAGSSFIDPAEARSRFDQLYSPVEVAVLTFPTETAAKSLNPSPEELQTYYQNHLNRYRTPEKRRLQFIRFDLTPDQLKLEGRARLDALQAVGQQAFDFTSVYVGDEAPAQPPAFTERAAQLGLKVETSDWITLASDFFEPRVTRFAFDLTPSRPISNYLQTETGFIVLHLLDIEPSTPQPFETVVAQVRADFIKETAARQTREKVESTRAQLLAALRNGASWKEAAAALNLKPLQPPAFIPAEPGELKIPNADLVRTAARLLQLGELSEPLPSDDAVSLVFILSRGQPAEDKRAQILPMLENQLADSIRAKILTEWIAGLASRPGNQFPNGLLDDAFPTGS
ncbi:MAG: peptidylprolyl isomerase [Verrucomicrobiia bacterium]